MSVNFLLGVLSNVLRSTHAFTFSRISFKAENVYCSFSKFFISYMALDFHILIPQRLLSVTGLWSQLLSGSTRVTTCTD